MFGHPTQHGHMMAGVAKALKSPKTPKHLKPHLESRMKKIKGQPITASKSAMKPKAPVKTTANTSQDAEKIVGKPPSPFANPMGSVNSPVGGTPQGAYAGSVQMNENAGKRGAGAPMYAPGGPVGGGMPDNSKQIGGRTGVGRTKAKKAKNPLY